jgi:hypothetical protein
MKPNLIRADPQLFTVQYRVVTVLNMAFCLTSKEGSFCYVCLMQFIAMFLEFLNAFEKHFSDPK